MAFVGVSLVLGSPGLDPAFQEWPHQSWVERKDHLTQFVGNTSPNAAQDTIHFLCLKCRMLDYDQLGVHQDPWVLFCQALSTDLCLRLFFPKCGTSQFLLNLMASIPAHFPSLLCSFWMPAQPSGVSTTSACLSLTNLLWVHSAPSPRLTLSRVSSVAQTWWSQQVSQSLFPAHLEDSLVSETLFPEILVILQLSCHSPDILTNWFNKNFLKRTMLITA